MKRLQFTQQINAPAATVWFAMWDDVHYRKWTVVFCEGSHAVSDWQVGGRIHFLTPDGSGMYSTITVMDKPHKMYFTHIGELKNFEEQPLDDKTTEWTGGVENYTLTEADGVTTVLLELDVSEPHVPSFEKIFPQAFALLKEAAEDLYITVRTTVAASVDRAWDLWTMPEHVMQWNTPSDDWHTTSATNDLRVGGQFSYHMAAKDGSFAFDFGGTYDAVTPQALIAYTLGDGRKVRVTFTAVEGGTQVTEEFQPESMHPLEFQRDGWQGIIDCFQRYVARQ